MKKENKKSELSNVTLHPWQQSVVDAIEKYASLKDSDEYQGLSEFVINKELGVRMTMPRASGHTFLANYIAHKYPAMLVYNKMHNYQQLVNEFPLHPSTSTISAYEIFYALHRPGQHVPNPEVLEIRDRIQGKQVVVIDEAFSVPEDVKNFLLEISPCIVIMLGH